MSASDQPVRQRSVSSSSKSKSKAAATSVQSGTEFTMSPSTIMRYFEPSAATAGMFLYAQGNSVVCCHHDTLTIERRFSRHSDEIRLLAVDTQSERGAGRLVVSYDAGQTAIVWDILSGEEVARFASYEHLTTAAWMRNGNVAFGNTQGNIILFEPETSEHISSRTLDQIAVTALAPAADCRTFAIGYQNGSLLICTLQPRFTIMHNLTTSRGPSPIVNLAWHASSSRQKSDMLAAQTNDSDLRVWSVAKSYNSSDPAKIVRILKRSENYLTGPNWMGWSKNGRIIQYSESQTLSWDVRTKHVTFDSIPTLEHIRGLAVYGPGASLFTLGPNNTVQQFDLNAPAVIVANVQHPANLLPPSPPVSIEEQEKGAVSGTSESEISIHIESVSESDEDRMSPLARMMRAQDTDSDGDVIRTASPASSREPTSSVSSASSRTPGRQHGSIQSRGLTDVTYISAGSSVRSPAVAMSEKPDRERDSYSLSSLSSVSMNSANNRPRRSRPSRLRNEIPRSPEDSKVHDLFKFTKSRLSDVPYKRPPVTDASRLTNDDLRRQMLSVIFGWNKDIRDLVGDESSRHPAGSPNRILLSKWLGDMDADVMTASSQNMTSSDWMILALSGIGGPESSQHKLGRAFVQRLLESGDVHAAATIMIGMGDHNDAIEIYISHKKFMEALILSCLFFPSVWERQAAIIKKWGGWAVQHGHQQLAIRCFACTGKESTEPWTSPSAVQVTFQNMSATIPEVLSPPLSPPGLQRGPQRSIAKTSALKLITSFGDQGSKAKYFTNQDDGQTPIAAGVTPIAESAISPGGDMTAFLRPGTRSTFNTPNSARSAGPSGGFNRQRLPSIGEVNDGGARDLLKVSNLPTPPVDQLEHPRGHPVRVHSHKVSFSDSYTAGIAIARAATASPQMMRDTHHKKEAAPLSPSPASMAVLMEAQKKRNGSRSRIPDGVEMQLHDIEIAMVNDQTSPEQSVSSSTRFHWPNRRRAPGSITSSSITSGSSVNKSQRSRGVDTGGKSLDDYIHSLDAAKSRTRGSSQEGKKPRESSRSRKTSSRERSGERGRTSSRGYTPKAGKRSPRSPVPMSPEDLMNLSTPRLDDIPLGEDGGALPSEDPATVKKATSQTRRSSKPRSVNSRNSDRSRRKSPDRRPPALDIARGRSGAREGSVVRSPSSPLPMSSNAQYYQASDDEDDYQKAARAQKQFRRDNRSTSRGRREPSPSNSQPRDTSQSRLRGAARERDSSENRIRTPASAQPAAISTGDLNQAKDERTLKKEAAARELEERRKSLARRPLAPSIPHPDELSPTVYRPPSNPFDLPSITSITEQEPPPRSQTADSALRRSPGHTPGHTRSMYAPRAPAIGLPATPKAMRLVMETDPRGVPGVPPIPSSFRKITPPTSENSSPKNFSPNKPAESAMTLLPSTVYSPPTRPQITRCVSAPPEEPAPPAALQGTGIGQTVFARGHPMRKLSTPDAHEAHHMSVRTIDGLMDSNRTGRRPSQDEYPPPPPPPPMLKELAHLAIPPPPPPAPLPFGHSGKPVVYGSGTIEIVMDDGQIQPVPSASSVPVAIPMAETTVPIIAPPAPPSSRSGHHRGRSSVDNSISARISRATERMRSASRGRNSTASRTKSPETMIAPYESIPHPPGHQQRVDAASPYESVPPPLSFQARAEMRSPQQQQPPAHDFRTGLLESEMI